MLCQRIHTHAAGVPPGRLTWRHARWVGISRIENLDPLTNLVSLDLSNNRIGVLGNLQALHRLRSVNVACNRMYVSSSSSSSGVLVPNTRARM